MDFDNIELKERENYARSSLLIVQYTKDGLADLIELNLKLTGFSSFQNFVNHYQHELYHLCYHQIKCCQCSRNYKLPQEQLIHPKQLEVLFDKSGHKKAKHNAFRIADFCCCLPRQNLSTSKLDVTLARCLLFYFCKEVFWYSSLKLQKTTLEEFLNQHKHTLYHLYDTSRRCCQCPPLYKFPTATELIDDSNWTELFSKRRMPCIRHTKRPIGKRNICSVSATPGILVSHLDPTISKILLEHCCALWKTIEKLILIRGTIFADVDEATIHENTYLEYKASLEYGIAVMARVCNKEHEVTEKLKRADKRKIDEIGIINTIRRQISCTGASRITEVIYKYHRLLSVFLASSKFHIENWQTKKNIIITGLCRCAVWNTFEVVTLVFRFCSQLQSYLFNHFFFFFLSSRFLELIGPILMELCKIM